ncbi:hypothetical protein FRC18_000015 [Serendipita sp. 400]|nr:hypothetical protein FRC18_000015 [Serendipita sp. 400]
MDGPQPVSGTLPMDAAAIPVGQPTLSDAHCSTPWIMEGSQPKTSATLPDAHSSTPWIMDGSSTTPVDTTEMPPPTIAKYEQKCINMSNDDLIGAEINKRRAIASLVASLSITTVVTVGTVGAVSPLTIPLGGWKVYKIRGNHKKLRIVRAELAKRNLTPVEKRKRDIFIPATVTMVTYVTTLGIADAFDFVPDTIQNAVQAPVAELIGSDTTVLSEGANKFQAFLIGEAAAPLIQKAQQSFQYRPSTPSNYPPPAHPPPGLQDEKYHSYIAPIHASKSEGSLPYVASPMEISPLSGTPSLYTTSSYSSTTSYDWSQASTSSSVSSSTTSRSASPMPFYPSPLHPPPNSNNNNSSLQPPPNDHHHLSRSWSDGSSLSVPPNHGYAHQHRPFHSASMPLGVPSPVPLHPPPYSSLSSEETNTTSYSPPQVEPTAAAPTAESSTEVQASPETLQIVDLPDVDSPTTAIALLFELPAETSILTTSVSSESTTTSMPVASAPSTPRASMVVLPTTDEPPVAVQHPEGPDVPALAGKEEIPDDTPAMDQIATVEPPVEVPLVSSPTTVAYLPATPNESNTDTSLGLEMAPPPALSVTPPAVSPSTTNPSSCLSLIVEPLFDQPSSSASSSSPSTEDMSLPTSIPLPDSPIEELEDQTLSVPTVNKDHPVAVAAAVVVVEDLPMMGTTAAPSSPSQTPRSSTVVLPMIEPTPELSIEDLFTAVLPTVEPLTTLSPVAESTSAPTLTVSDATLSSSVAASGTVPVPPPALPPLCFTPVFAPPAVAPPPPTTAPPNTRSQLIQSPLDAPPTAFSTLKFTPPVLPPPLILPQWTASTVATTTSTSAPSLDSTAARCLANSQTMAPSASVVDSPATMVTPSFGPPSFAPPPVAPYTPATFTTASSTVEPSVFSPLAIVPPPTTPSVATSTIVSPVIIAPPVVSPPVVLPPMIPLPSSLTAPPAILSPPTFAPPSIAPPIAAAAAAPVTAPFYTPPPLAPPPSFSSSSFSAAAAPLPIMETVVIAPLAVAAIEHPTVVELSTLSSQTLVGEERRPTFGFGPPMTAPPSASNVLTRSNSLVSLQSQSAVTPTDVSPIAFSLPPPPAVLPPWMASLSSPLPPRTISPPSKTLPAIPSPSPSPSPSPFAEPPIIPPPSKAPPAIVSPPMFAPPSVAPPVVAAPPLYNPPTAPPSSSFFSVAATPSVPLMPPPGYTLEYSSGYPGGNPGYPSGGNYPGAPSDGAHPPK